MGKVYIETTIPSYVTSRLNRDLVVAAQQQVTREWWETERFSYKLYISEAVITECRCGDEELAKRRLELIKGLPVLHLNDEITKLAEDYLNLLEIPNKASIDALHLATAVYNEIDFLLTWNCKHLAHGEVRARIHNFNKQNNLFEPVILTPNELMRRD